MNEDIALIDSNILVYAYDDSDKIKQEKARRILEKCFEGIQQYAVCLQNISEFLFVVTNKIEYTLPVKEAQIIIKDLLRFRNLRKVQYQERTILKAADFVDKYGVDYWDALIAATMIENGITTIVTENSKDFNKIKEIQVINPF